MSRTITIPEEAYSELQKAAYSREVSPRELVLELITNLNKSKQTSWYKSFKQSILRKHPELAGWTKQQFVEEFDKLSQKAAEGFSFESLEEMERFMRREEFDSRRH